MLISNKFEGDGFGSWQKSMTIALSAKNKLQFVKGQEIGDRVLYANTVAKLWEELDERFGQSNGARLYQIQKDICSTSQGNLDIAGYYTKIKRLWDELALVSNLPDCSCGAAQAIIKHEQDQKLVQFLMGLNSDYNTIRGNILIMRPLPSVSIAYGILIQEEKQRQIQAPVPFVPEHTSLNVNTQNAYRGRYDEKKIVICEYCKKKGHSANKCYRLVGFSKDFKFAKGKKVAANVFTGEDIELNDSRLDEQFTPEMCSRFMNTFHGDKTQHSVNPMSQAFSAHMAALHQMFVSYKVL
ncbi:unnamed protein product [Cuscuta campestris]|uniref:Retrotransposon Copia-like N-terminal domain-containing protein n=1 Tax=Cuscuta campestris TaxID=132261 RepID=A0A484K7P7_9ASTE|nr:unnamed protein product [Cuscuta campestris]